MMEGTEGRTSPCIYSTCVKEILRMVGEAAVIRMFEERKDKDEKTMGKREKRVDKITALLVAENITQAGHAPCRAPGIHLISKGQQRTRVPRTRLARI
jgi:hypothetical protein